MKADICRTCREKPDAAWAKTQNYKRTKLCRYCAEAVTREVRSERETRRTRAMDDRSVQELYDDGQL